RSQRRGEPGRPVGSVVAYLWDAHPRCGQGEVHHRDEAGDEPGLRGNRERPLLPSPDGDAVRRRQAVPDPAGGGDQVALAQRLSCDGSAALRVSIDGTAAPIPGPRGAALTSLGPRPPDG